VRVKRSLSPERDDFVD